jgi:hypothetical protein
MARSLPLRVTSFAMAAAVATAVALPAAAQQIGKRGWEPSPRARSLSSQYQFQKQFYGSSDGGMGALTQYVTNYNSSSTSIGNYTEVLQTLGEGATGTVSQNATQDSSGTQDSVSDTHDNATSNLNNDVSVGGKGKGDRNAAVSNGQADGTVP